MKIYGFFIIALQMIRVHSDSRIFLHSDNDTFANAAVNIVEMCFGSSERWSELLIIAGKNGGEIVEGIYRKSKTSNSILSLDDEFAEGGEKARNYLNAGIAWLQGTKPTGFMIITNSSEHLDSVLSFLKNDDQRIWRPGSYFLIIMETRCDPAECNEMLKVIWDYWILNAVIMCSSSSHSTNRNPIGIELYTFNPYSADHSPPWRTIIHEIVEVSIEPGSFNHSWYIFKRTAFDEIRYSEDCGDIFFDKTSNLDGYVIPMSFIHPGFLSAGSQPSILFAADSLALKTLAKLLRFDVAQVITENSGTVGRQLSNGSYSGIMSDIYNERSHLAPTIRGLRLYPGIGTTYPHSTASLCFASRIVGSRPQWMNLVDAKYIWIALGLGLIFSSVVLYLQNKSYGFVSALLDAERLMIGNSIIHMSMAMKHRIILGSIFIMLLVFDGAIRGRFISILTVVKSQPNLDTIEELNEQKVNVYGHELIKQSITNPQIIARFNSNLDSSDCLEVLERDERQRACFVDCQELKYLTLNSSVIHTASYPVFTSYVTFLTAINWPMKDRYSFGLQKLLEAGILDKWQSDTYRRVESSSWGLKRAAEEPHIRPTKLIDLIPAFVLLFSGLLIALIVFAWEMKSDKI